MTEKQHDLRVDGERLKKSILELAAVGGTPGGGVSRLALTDEDGEARRLLVGWMGQSGLAVSVDEIGNIFGKREGIDSSLSPVVVGSHIDTQPFGGKLDGAYGVLASLEALRRLEEENVRTLRPIEMASWTNEEGTRFQPAMMGSGVFTGKFTLDHAYGRRDRDGKAVGDELDRIGFKGPAPCKPRRLHAYLELHIEQGPVLEREQLPIGVVEGIVSIRWFRVTVEGEANHSGPTPMESRRDALVAAADMVRAIRDIPSKIGRGLVSTVGSLDVYPNSINIIPGRAVFTIDFRCFDEGALDEAVETAKRKIAKLAHREGCTASVEVLEEVPRAVFTKRAVEAVERSATESGLPHMRMVSGAGHDAQYMNSVCDTAMIFVPSRGGKSHCEDESTDWGHMEAGGNVLLRSMLALAGED